MCFIAFNSVDGLKERSVPTRLRRYHLPPPYVVAFFVRIIMLEIAKACIRKLSYFRYVSEEFLEPDNVRVIRRPLMLYEERHGPASAGTAAANPPPRFTRSDRQKVRI